MDVCSAAARPPHPRDPDAPGPRASCRPARPAARRPRSPGRPPGRRPTGPLRPRCRPPGARPTRTSPLPSRLSPPGEHLAAPSALRATWVMTCARDQPGQSEGRRTASSSSWCTVSSSRSVSAVIRSSVGSSANPVMLGKLPASPGWGRVSVVPPSMATVPARKTTVTAAPSSSTSTRKPSANATFEDDAALPRHSADRLVIRGAREHNLKDVSLDLPRDALIVFTGLSGSGQVLAGVRHDLRRGPAALRRVAVVLRPAVPRADGQAGRRLHRGSLAGGLDRPEVDQPQPPVHGGHDHRGLRLPAAALRPGRPAALPGLRRADHPADPAADRRPAAGAARGHPVPGAGAGRARPQGRVRRPVPRAAGQGLRPGPGRRRGRSR